jgi:hypothetical protein
MTSELRRQLNLLHEQLGAVTAVDQETKQQLMVLLADISRLLGAGAESQEHSPVERLETLAARFDADHPALSTALRQLMDALGKAGI